MVTFLVSLGVVAATIAVVLRVALSGPDQPATIRRQPPRARPSRASRRAGARPPSAARLGAPAAAAATATIPGVPSLSLPESDAMRLRVLPAQPTTLWVRIRSFVALVVLVAVLGALLALAIGGLLVGAAFLIRSATG